MDAKEIELNEKRMERAITKIGAEIADANDIAEEMIELSHESARKLDEAQEDLEDLYVSMGETAHLRQRAEGIAPPAKDPQKTP